MDINEAKSLVIDAGKKLVENGLIARTWGNVSCRINDEQFVITPSGRDYNSLTPEEIVTVTIDGCEWDGDVKPSSEKGIHAACYRLRPEVNFVIHTHQTFASLVSVSGRDLNGISGEAADIIGTDVPAATYGLPGTGKLKKGVADAVARSDSKAVLMPHHGTICMGTDEKDTFRVALELERVCRDYILDRYEKIAGKPAETFSSVSGYISSTLMRARSSAPELDAWSSEKDGETMVMTRDNGSKSVRVLIDNAEPVDGKGEAPDTAPLHAAVYAAREDAGYIIHSKEESVVAVSAIGKTIKPFLDDMAQIAGISLKNAEYFPGCDKSIKKCVKKLRGRNAVLLRNNGALCVSADKSETEAVEMVVEKGCKAAVAANLFCTKGSPIKMYECALMRLVYKMKYSKQINK